MGLEYGDDQACLGGEVVVDAGLADVDDVSNIGVAEGGVAAINDQGLGGFEDVVCSFALHADETTN